jgi:hypothetical protein
LSLFVSRRHPERSEGPPQLSSLSPELVALWTLILYPILGYLIAIAGAGMISPRCVVPVCCGFGLAFGLLAQKVFGTTRRAAIATVLVMAFWVTAREWVCANVLLQQQQAFFTLRGTVAMSASKPIPTDSPLQLYQVTGTGPILLADSSFALPLYYYSTENVRQRILFPIDFDAIHRFAKDDSGEQNLWAGRNGVFPFPIVPFSSVTLTPQMTVVAPPGSWLVDSIRKSGIPLKVDPSDTTDWSRTGGVFTPMAHFETRILRPDLPKPPFQ